MQPSPPRPNTPFGPYHLMRLLARGGMGHVFLARTTGTQNRVVVKVLQPDLGAQRDMRSMFLHEARLGSLLQHPNIARIHDYGEQDGVLYLAMEYVDGLPLSAVMRRLKGRVPLGSALRIVADVAAALGYAHTVIGPTGEPLQVVHRDVTPQNILVSRRGLVKLIDFGVAKSAGQDHRTRTGVLKGKLAYMAPEQFRGQTSNRTDIFALGVVLHELVSAKRLFRRPTEAETFGAILTEPIPRLRTEDRIARVLQPIVDRALAREVDDRYAYAHELETDLRNAMHQLELDCTPQDLARLSAVPRPLAGSSQATADDEAADPGGTSASGMRMRDGESGHSSQEWCSASGFGPGESATSTGDAAPVPAEGAGPQALFPEAPEDTVYDPGLHRRGADTPGPGDGQSPRRALAGAAGRRWSLWIGAAVAAAVAVTGAVVSLSKGEMQRVVISPPPPDVGQPASDRKPPAPKTLPTNLGSNEEPSGVATEDEEPEPPVGEEGESSPPATEPLGSDDPSASVSERTRAARHQQAETGQRARRPARPRSDSASRARRRAERTASKAPATPGRLFLDTDPWTFVKVGGRSLGQTPIVDVEIPAGRHVLELREAGGQVHRVPVQVAPGGATKKFVRLDR